MRHLSLLACCFAVLDVGCSSSSNSNTSVQSATTDGSTASAQGDDPNVANPNAANPNVTLAQDPNHPTSGPTVRLLGRFDTSNPNRAVFAWSASSMLTRVQGTGLTINLADPNATLYQGTSVHNWYDVFVDGVKTSAFQVVAGTTSYTVVSGLPAADHIIKVTKRTEAQMGPATFGGFTPLAGGTLLPAPQPSPRRIEFIGDSITAGYGADGNVATASGCPFTPETENADGTFASLTATTLGAEFYAIGFSGKGLVQNDDCLGDAYYTLPILYPSIIPIGDAGNANDAVFDAWIPQAVVINLGTNDYNEDNNCAVPKSATFTQGWVDFIKLVRGNYPNAAIFATVGPELHKTNLTTAQANIAAAVATLKAGGDSNVFAIVLPEDTGANGYGCAGHPNRATHQAMASVVTAAIKKQLAW